MIETKRRSGVFNKLTRGVRGAIEEKKADIAERAELRAQEKIELKEQKKEDKIEREKQRLEDKADLKEMHREARERGRELAKENIAMQKEAKERGRESAREIRLAELEKEYEQAALRQMGSKTVKSGASGGTGETIKKALVSGSKKALKAMTDNAIASKNEKTQYRGDTGGGSNIMFDPPKKIKTQNNVITQNKVVTTSKPHKPIDMMGALDSLAGDMGLISNNEIVVKKAPVKKTTAKKTATKKTTAKKTATKKTKAKKTIVKKAPVKKTTAKKTPVKKKAATKKTPAKKYTPKKRYKK